MLMLPHQLPYGSISTKRKRMISLKDWERLPITAAFRLLQLLRAHDSMVIIEKENPMPAIQQASSEPVVPTEHDMALAEQSSRVLARYLPKRPGDVKLRLVEDGHETDAV